MSKPYGPWVAAAAAATLLASFHSLPVSAETIVVGDHVQVRQTEVPHPRRGVSMAQVEKRFGEPRERHPAVGTPPITRWDYEHFAVFFEKDLVIDAVVPGSTAGSPDAAPIPTAAPAAVAPAQQAAGVHPAEAAPATAPAPAAPRAADSQKPGSASPGDVPLSDVSLHH